ncbi:TonB-dependent siderophore receptor [Aurantimonas endophytica]|uniref:Iron complex outermembrane receptor protein n=1 Tax=Aurantimonas endophytica TaxID=1522175 RepID=A0A7W6MQ34_9HYPH|nr:TonB-dependent siderophore receptor [Aurantimonas endophytica]MBB4003558.1 iron complex outermembrane receptor protein [Aurantimonas endophytica]MCO6404416.1 TonB-dependent siderophore receptor [Aurantimonas endophytica]
MRNTASISRSSLATAAWLQRLAATTALGLFWTSAAADAQETTIQLETVTIEGAGTASGTSEDGFAADGYVPQATVSATKTDTPLVRVPQSVSVITEQQLEDRNPQSLLETLSYTPGVRIGAYGFDPRFDAFFIRGFPATYTGIFRDGLRQFGNGFATFDIEPYGLGGLSILKGPSAGLYGSSNAGGIVDLRSKRPTTEVFREVETQIGTNDRYQANFDAAGPMNADGTASYRLTGVARDSDTDYPFTPDDRLSIAPAFTWAPDGDTSLTILGELQRSRSGGTAAYVNVDNSVTHVAGGDPSFNDLDQTQGRIGLEFEHRLDDVFTFRQKARYQDLDIYSEYVYAFGGPVNGIVDRGSGVLDQTLGGIVSDSQLQAEFDTGVVGHTLLAGVDASYAEFTNKEGYGTASSLVFAAPRYDAAVAKPDYSVASEQQQRQVGLYVQDEIAIDRLLVTLGGRYDWIRTETAAGVPGDLGDWNEQKDEAFSGRVGLSYLFDSGIAPYVSYSTAFTPNIGTAADGAAFVPTEAEQYEAGVKYEIQGANAFITAAVFDITQENGVFFDVNTETGVNEEVQRGELRSRGFELEGTASLGNGLSLIASYAYTDMEIVEGTETTTGRTLSSTPYHTASVWGDYTIEGGVADGLGFGAGVRYVGKSYGDDENSFENSERFFIDAALHYDIPQLEGARLQVNATNLFDEDSQICSSGFCYREPGRNVIGSVRYRF